MAYRFEEEPDGKTLMVEMDQNEAILFLRSIQPETIEQEIFIARLIVKYGGMVH